MEKIFYKHHVNGFYIYEIKLLIHNQLMEGALVRASLVLFSVRLLKKASRSLFSSVYHCCTTVYNEATSEQYKCVYNAADARKFIL